MTNCPCFSFRAPRWCAAVVIPSSYSPLHSHLSALRQKPPARDRWSFGQGALLFLRRMSFGFLIWSTQRKRGKPPFPPAGLRPAAAPQGGTRFLRSLPRRFAGKDTLYPFQLRRLYWHYTPKMNIYSSIRLHKNFPAPRSVLHVLSQYSETLPDFRKLAESGPARRRERFGKIFMICGIKFTLRGK